MQIHITSKVLSIKPFFLKTFLEMTNMQCKQGKISSVLRNILEATMGLAFGIIDTFILEAPSAIREAAKYLGFYPISSSDPIFFE